MRVVGGRLRDRVATTRRDPWRWALLFVLLATALPVVAAPPEPTLPPAFAQPSLSDAAADQREGRAKEAAVKLLTLLKREPDNGEAHRLLGLVYLDLANGTAAEAALRQAAALGIPVESLQLPIARALLYQESTARLLAEVQVRATLSAAEQADLRVLRAQAHLLERDENAAAAELDQALALVPDHPRALLGKAQLALNRGDGAGARGLMQRVLAGNPFDAETHHAVGELDLALGRPAEAEAAFTAAIRERPGQWLSFYKRALARQANGDASGALADVLEAERLFTDFPRLLLLKAHLLVRTGEPAKAQAALDRFLHLVPNAPETFLDVGQTLLDIGRNAEAADYLFRYCQAQPNAVPATLALAVARLRLGDPAGAEQALARAYSLPETRPAVVLVLSEAIAGQGRTAEAVAVLRDALQAEPQRVDLRLALARRLLDAGTPEPAIVELRTLLAATGGPESVRVPLVQALLKAGRVDEALEEARAAVDTLPDSALAQTALGMALAAKGDATQARIAFSLAHQVRPDLPTAALGLAEAQLAAGNDAAARALYEEVLAQDPDNVALILALAALDRRATPSAGGTGDPVAVLRLALAQRPNNLTLRLAVARAQLAAEDTAAAIQILEGRPPAQRADAGALELLGQAQLAAKAPADAAVAFAGLVEVQPGTAAPRYLLALALAANKDARVAEEALRQGWERDPQHPLAVEALAALWPLLTPEQSGALIGALGSDPARQSALLPFQVRSALQSNDAPRAVELARAWVASAPGASAPVLELMSALVASGASEEAIALGEEAAQRFPREPAIAGMAAELWVRRGVPESAIALYRQALRGSPEHHLTLNNLAALLVSTVPREAVDYARRAVALQPAQPSYQATLGSALLATGAAGEALAVLQRAFGGRPDSPSIATSYAEALAATGDREGALRLLAGLQGQSFPEHERAMALLRQLDPSAETR